MRNILVIPASLAGSLTPAVLQAITEKGYEVLEKKDPSPAAVMFQAHHKTEIEKDTYIRAMKKAEFKHQPEPWRKASYRAKHQRR